MIDPNTKLTIKHDDNSSFSDYSDEAADFIRDEFSMTLSSTEDYFYMGFSKPFGAAFFKFVTANTNTNEFAAEYYDGTAWQTLSVTDETQGFTRSGFMYWDKSNMNSVEIDGNTRYYIRIRPSADHTATSFRAANLIFSDDNALKQEFFEIDNSNLLPPGESDHVVNHVAARNVIVQKLRNLGYIKTNADSVDKIITQWDLIDIFEIKQAATMLALSKIFFNLSDSVDDNWWQKYREYQDKFEEMFKLATLSIDLDDDGVDDNRETDRQMNVQRWVR